MECLFFIRFQRPPVISEDDFLTVELMKSVGEGLSSAIETSLDDSTTRLQLSFSSVVSELRKRNVDPLRDPDYTLIVRAQDLEGASDMALSGVSRVQVIVLENLWVNPGPVLVPENLEAVYPLVIAKVTFHARASSSRSRANPHAPTFLPTRLNPTIRKPSTR